MKYDAVLFDLDGTLTQSGEGITRSAAYALDEMGIPYEGSLEEFIGPPLGGSFMKKGVPADRVEEAVRLYRKRYTSIGKFENQPYEGIREMLGELKKAGLRLFTATSKPQQMAEEILVHFGLDGYFEMIAGAAMDHSRETKAEVLAYLLDACAEIRKPVMIGDTVYDVLGAKEKGIPCIGCAWGYGSVREMEMAGAVEIAYDVEQLLEMLVS